MLNFAVGPVMSGERIRAIGAEQVPYFRTPEFSALMLDNERLIKKMANAETEARAVFLTGSGTASMEAAIMNALTSDDKALIVNGGSFGQRFADMLKLHKIPNTEIRLPAGKALTSDMLASYENRGYTAFLVNVHETSTGVLYDMDLIGDFCRRNRLFLIADCISSFLADSFDMSALGADVMITGSQKALACSPGVSILVLSREAVERVNRNEAACMYLDLKSALKDGERGQTPFTPAVGILRQIWVRLMEIDSNGGVEAETARIAALAAYFRNAIRDLPLQISSESLSNAVTPLHPLNVSAYEIFLKLKDEYGIWVCPNGGALRDTLFRVGHIGALKESDYNQLTEALRDMRRRGLL